MSTANEQQPETKRTRTGQDLSEKEDTCVGKELHLVIGLFKARSTDNIKNPILKYIENPVAARTEEEEERVRLNAVLPSLTERQQEINYRNVIFIDRDNDYDNT